MAYSLFHLRLIELHLGEDGTRLWDLQTSKLLSSPIGSSHRGTTTAIAWIVRPDNTEEALAFGTNDGFLCIWKRAKEENVRFMIQHDIGAINSQTILKIEFIKIYCNRLVGGPDGLEVSGIAPVVVKLIQIPQHWPQAVCFGQTGVGGPEIWSFGREDGMIGHATINVKEDALIIDNVAQGIAVFKLLTTDRLKTFDVPFTTSRLRSVAFHDGNSAIITGSDHGKVYIFDRRTGDVIDKIDIRIVDWVQSVATMEKNGVPLIFIGRSGANVVGRNDVQVWEKVLAPPKEDKTRKGLRKEVLGLMCLLSILFVMENILTTFVIGLMIGLKALCIQEISIHNSTDNVYKYVNSQKVRSEKKISSLSPSKNVTFLPTHGENLIRFLLLQLSILPAQTASDSSARVDAGEHLFFRTSVPLSITRVLLGSRMLIISFSGVLQFGCNSPPNAGYWAVGRVTGGVATGMLFGAQYCFCLSMTSARGSWKLVQLAKLQWLIKISLGHSAHREFRILVLNCELDLPVVDERYSGQELSRWKLKTKQQKGISSYLKIFLFGLESNLSMANHTKPLLTLGQASSAVHPCFCNSFKAPWSLAGVSCLTGTLDLCALLQLESTNTFANNVAEGHLKSVESGACSAAVALFNNVKWNSSVWKGDMHPRPLIFTYQGLKDNGTSYFLGWIKVDAVTNNSNFPLHLPPVLKGGDLEATHFYDSEHNYGYRNSRLKTRTKLHCDPCPVCCGVHRDEATCPFVPPQPIALDAVKHHFETIGDMIMRRDLASKIVDFVQEHHFLLIQAPPCTGKTTLIKNIGLHLLETWPRISLQYSEGQKVTDITPKITHNAPPIHSPHDLMNYLSSRTHPEGPFWLLIDECQLTYENRKWWDILYHPPHYHDDLFVVAAGSFGSHSDSQSHSPPINVPLAMRMPLFSATLPDKDLFLAFTEKHLDNFFNAQNKVLDKDTIIKYASPATKYPLRSKEQWMDAFHKDSNILFDHPHPLDIGQCLPRQPPSGFSPIWMLMFSSVMWHGYIEAPILSRALPELVVENSYGLLHESYKSPTFSGVVDPSHLLTLPTTLNELRFLAPALRQDYSMPKKRKVTGVQPTWIQRKQATKARKQLLNALTSPIPTPTALMSVRGFVHETLIARTPRERFEQYPNDQSKPYSTRQMVQSDKALNNFEQAAHDARQLGWLLEVPFSKPKTHCRMVLPSQWHFDYLEKILAPKDVTLPESTSLDDFILTVVKNFNGSYLLNCFNAEGTLRERVYEMEFYRCAHRIAGARFLTPQARTADGSGYADFVVRSRQWIIELVCEGDRLKHHMERIGDDGTYTKQWPNHEKLLVDFHFKPIRPRKPKHNNESSKPHHAHYISVELVKPATMQRELIQVTIGLKGLYKKYQYTIARITRTIRIIHKTPRQKGKLTALTSKFIDLEAQIASDEELSEGEEITRQGDVSFLNDAPADPKEDAGDSVPSFQLSENSAKSSASLHKLVERIEHQYVNNQAPPSQARAGKQDSRLPHNRLFLQENDWKLWRIKCTPSKKYDIIYKLMRRQTLSGELRSAFYNPRDVKFIYLEAKFTMFGIASLYEVLREFSALKMSSLAPVPESDLQQCLTIGHEPLQVFAAGQWVQIKHGLYRGNIRLVVEDFLDEDSVTLFTVMVVPRLEFAEDDDDESRPSKHKWKHQPRPSPRLFNLDECKQENLVQQGDLSYSYKGYSFKYGLQLKKYSERSLSPADEIPPLSFDLFKAAKDRGAEIDMLSMPIRSFWRFEHGEQVIIHPSKKFATIASSFNPVDAQCQVEIDEEGLQLVLVKDIKKDIIPGHYVELLAEVHSGKKGFVIGRTVDRLAIWFDGQDDWQGTEAYIAVTSSRSLAIAVRLLTGDECTIEYHAVREYFTGRLLLDHQPLKRHQQQFNVELPWKEVEVEIHSGCFAKFEGIVKNVRVDFRGCLRLLLWVPSHNCSIDVDYSTVLEKLTRTELQVFHPLEGYDLKHFGVSPSIESVRSGPIPWLGLPVDITAGEYKGTGVVRDVNCFRVDPNRHYDGHKIKPSGLTLTIEQYVYTAGMSFQMVKVDYDAVRFHKSFYTRTQYRLCEVFMPTARQSFYMPDGNYQKNLSSPTASFDAVDVVVDPDQGHTPMPNDFERATIFCGSWSPNCPTPGSSSFQSPFAGSQTGFQSPMPWTASPSPPPLSSPSSPSPRSLSQAYSPALSPPDHWILHPKLVGIPIRVDIAGGGELNTSKKKNGATVEMVSNNEDGLSVLCCLSPTKSVPVHYQLIQSFRERPIPAREKNLMVIVRNREQIGKLVRRYHHFYLEEKTENNHWMMVMEVDRSGREEKVNNYLEVHPDDVEYVYETPAEVRWAKELFCDIRQDYKGAKAEVRTLSDHS
ncbi:hypothetical protein BT96DRAFT_949731 [Gymnopus androsaceus JB14]|uniref:Uncharacterized protein n=1 Tax=Gymnopus androsaceus JB14 TaxID=1447944 RepID=A0A6A4GJL3_9AGAR|nr:hypothetical protein BT96DRAFT_949731 [Gymnopus androsaceus JB14]